MSRRRPVPAPSPAPALLAAGPAGGLAARLAALALLAGCVDAMPKTAGGAGRADTGGGADGADGADGTDGADEDGSPADEDCDDADPAVRPGATDPAALPVACAADGGEVRTGTVREDPSGDARLASGRLRRNTVGSSAGVGGGVGLYSGTLIATGVDMGSGADDNLPDDVAWISTGAARTGLGAGTNLTCSGGSCR
jgi:hypothetical protein